MGDADDAVDWRALREFAGVELDRSYVLSWHTEGDSLLIDVDLVLQPEHPFYERPRPAEKRCIRPAIIEFPYCDSVRLDGAGPDVPLNSAVAGLRLGAIAGFKRQHEGPFIISGEFGEVYIDAERPILRLRPVA